MVEFDPLFQFKQSPHSDQGDFKRFIEDFVAKDF